jgi:hypothetical protein
MSIPKTRVQKRSQKSIEAIDPIDAIDAIETIEVSALEVNPVQINAEPLIEEPLIEEHFLETIEIENENGGAPTTSDNAPDLQALITTAQMQKIGASKNPYQQPPDDRLRLTLKPIDALHLHQPPPPWQDPGPVVLKRENGVPMNKSIDPRIIPAKSDWSAKREMQAPVYLNRQQRYTTQTANSNMSSKLAQARTLNAPPAFSNFAQLVKVKKPHFF